MTPPSSISAEISSIMYCSIKNDLNIYSKTVMKLEKIKIELAEKFSKQLEFTPLVLYYLLYNLKIYFSI